METLEIRMIEEEIEPLVAHNLDIELDKLQCKQLEVNLLIQLQHTNHQKVLKDIFIVFMDWGTGYKDIIVHMNRQQAQNIITELTSVKKHPYHLWVRGERI